MQDKLLNIINHYGVVPQLKHFNSEVFELTEAVVNCDLMDLINDGDPHLTNSRENFKKHIAEEIADCLVMLRQFQEYYKIDESEICEICEKKVNRQLERISLEDEHERELK